MQKINNTTCNGDVCDFAVQMASNLGVSLDKTQKVPKSKFNPYSAFNHEQVQTLFDVVANDKVVGMTVEVPVKVNQNKNSVNFEFADALNADSVAAAISEQHLSNVKFDVSKPTRIIIANN